MKIRELLAKPEAWTTVELARDANGEYADLYSQEAKCWCLIGASFRCYGEVGVGEVFERIKLEIGGNIPSWNDQKGRTHAEVLALVTKLDI